MKTVSAAGLTPNALVSLLARAAEGQGQLPTACLPAFPQEEPALRGLSQCSSNIPILFFPLCSDHLLVEGNLRKALKRERKLKLPIILPLLANMMVEVDFLIVPLLCTYTI